MIDLHQAGQLAWLKLLTSTGTCPPTEAS